MAEREEVVNPRARVEELIAGFLADSPENSLHTAEREPVHEEVLVGYASGADPVFESFKEHVGPFHFTPAEIFNLTFPGAPARPEELTVVGFVLPHTEAVKADSRRETFYPSERWVRARFGSGRFGDALHRHLVAGLGRAGIPAVAPYLSPEWAIVEESRFGRSSRWSQRHAVYAAGLGTFGLCDGLITPKGKAHRVGSIVARVRIEPTPRPYADHRAYCLFFNGGCTVCIERCPAGAITEDGHDKKKCRAHAVGVGAPFAREVVGVDSYGCCMCQTGVPCESGIPTRALCGLEVSGAQAAE